MDLLLQSFLLLPKNTQPCLQILGITCFSQRLADAREAAALLSSLNSLSISPFSTITSEIHESTRFNEALLEVAINCLISKNGLAFPDKVAKTTPHTQKSIFFISTKAWLLAFPCRCRSWSCTCHRLPCLAVLYSPCLNLEAELHWDAWLPKKVNSGGGWEREQRKGKASVRQMRKGGINRV